MRNRYMWGNLWDAIKARWTLPETKRRLVGADYMGNKYFECEHSRYYRRFTRHFERDLPPETEPFDILQKQVPPAWDAWLRFRRSEPPSEEEIREQVEYYEMQQARAKKAAEEQEASNKTVGKLETSKYGFPKLPLDQAKQAGK